MKETLNFLTKEECAYFIDMIDKNHAPSSVVEGGKELSTISDTRTSSTCNLNHRDEKVQQLQKKIADFLGIELAKGEHLQGQLYEEGQYFKPHQDFFSGPAIKKHCLHSGNRTDTLMIYLNDDFEGGGTNFVNQNKIVQPKEGMALSWKNMVNGEMQNDSMHEGMPIIKGKKYIITSWWRENSWDNVKDQNMFFNKPKEYNDINDLPKLTPNGYKVVKCPPATWALIQDAYTLLKEKSQPEEFQGKEQFIPTGDTELFSFDHLPYIRSLIHTQLQPIHEDFARQQISPSFIYGIRSYKRGSTLATHTDRVATHHVSSIIIVDKDLRCGCQHKEFGDDWALDIQDHNGNWNKVYANVGEMILYESARCAHGRVDSFQGTYFRNFYVHYQLA
jgi:prolyl 4-hydroxylase